MRDPSNRPSPLWGSHQPCHDFLRASPQPEALPTQSFHSPPSLPPFTDVRPASWSEILHLLLLALSPLSPMGIYPNRCLKLLIPSQLLPTEALLAPCYNANTESLERGLNDIQSQWIVDGHVLVHSLVCSSSLGGIYCSKKGH